MHTALGVPFFIQGRNFTQVLTISLFQNNPFAHRSPFPHWNYLSPGDGPQGKRMHEWSPVVAGEGCALMAGLWKCSPDQRPNNALATTELLPKAEEWGAEVWEQGNYTKSTAGFPLLGTLTSLWRMLHAFTLTGSTHNKQQKITEISIEQHMPWGSVNLNSV